MSLISKLIFQVLPPRCPVTNEIVESQGMLSPKAWQSLNFIESPLCQCCGLPLTIKMEDVENLLCGPCVASPKVYNQSRSAVVYDDASRDLILAFKHGDQTHLSLTFVPWLKRAGQDLLTNCDLLIPVPLHWMRLLKRRYNQSALLAQLLSKESGITYEPEILKRIRHTPVQGHLSLKERYKNVSNAFQINKKYQHKVKGKRIVIVDDVYTTGATIEECAEVLYAAGAERVDVLTIARVSRPDNIS